MDTLRHAGRPLLLIVEDDHDMRSLLCDELWDLNVNIMEAKDGDEALQCVGEQAPDLIITDLRMPAGGVDYLWRLRVLAPDCPIVLMTAFGDVQTKAAALKAGVTLYFDKPVRMKEVKETVRRLLDRPNEFSSET